MDAGDHDRWCTTTITEHTYTALSRFSVSFCMNKVLYPLPASVKNHYPKSISYLNYILLDTLSVDLC